MGPQCPGCGHPPRFLLDDGRQAFCGSDDCHVIMWNPTKTLAEMSEDAQFIKFDLGE